MGGGNHTGLPIDIAALHGPSERNLLYYASHVGEVLKVIDRQRGYNEPLLIPCDYQLLWSQSRQRLPDRPWADAVSGSQLKYFEPVAWHQPAGEDVSANARVRCGRLALARVTQLFGVSDHRNHIIYYLIEYTKSCIEFTSTLKILKWHSALSNSRETMKLLRYKVGGVARLGALKDGGIVDLGPVQGQYGTMLAIIAGGSDALRTVRTLVSTSSPQIALADARLLAPVERPGKYLAIGMNYRKHLAEAERIGVPAPKQQLWFNKQTSCIAGPFDDIDPGVTKQLDYEVELGVVIGKAAKRISEHDAKGHVFGYFVANDISARDWQFHSPTFTIGKSFDTHGPIGPWIVTADEIDDPHALKLRCLVNGEVRQESDTGQMIFNVWQQISYLSTAFTLEPGDLIATGTPEGVGVAMQPPRLLQPGDVVQCAIEKIGSIENTVIQPSV